MARRLSSLMLLVVVPSTETAATFNGTPSDSKFAVGLHEQRREAISKDTEEFLGVVMLALG